jgi:hypothetical protein
MISGGWKWIEQGVDFCRPASLELLFAATLILLTAMVINLGLRRAAAAVRHRVWALTMGGLLLLPWLCPLLPKLPIPLSIPVTSARPAALTPEQIDESVVAPPPRDALSPEVAVLPMVPRLDHFSPLPSSASAPQVLAVSAEPRQATASPGKAPSGNSRSLLLESRLVLLLLWMLGTGLYLVTMADPCGPNDGWRRVSFRWTTLPGNRWRTKSGASLACAER